MQDSITNISTNQRFAYFLKSNKRQKLLPDWLIYLTVLHMIGG